MNTTRVPVLEAVRAAAAFARLNAPKAAGALGLVMLLNIASNVTGHSAAAGFLLGALGLLAGVMANGALLRLAFAAEHPDDPDFKLGPMGLQWGRTETRLLGAVLLVMLFVLLAALLLVLLALIVTIATLAASGTQIAVPDAAHVPPGAQTAVALLLLAFACAGLWAAVRICLYPAATVARKKVQVFSTWKLTQGNFWRILAAILILLVPAFLLMLAVGVARPFPAVQGGLAILFSAVGAFVIGPMVTGLYAYLYGGLSGSAAARPLDAPAATPADGGLAGPWG